MSESTSSGENPRKPEPPSVDEMIAYIDGSLPKRRRFQIDALSQKDPEMTIESVIANLLTEASMNRDMITILRFANAFKIPLEKFIPDEYEIVAGATFELCKGAVTKQEARAYAFYRKKADELKAHETQIEQLDIRALQEVVRLEIYRNIQEAEVAVRKVLSHLGPILQKIYESHPPDSPELL